MVIHEYCDIGWEVESMNDGYRFLLDADLDFWMKLASPDPVTYEMRDGGDSLMLFISS